MIGIYTGEGQRPHRSHKHIGPSIIKFKIGLRAFALKQKPSREMPNVCRQNDFRPDSYVIGYVITNTQPLYFLLVIISTNFLYCL